NIVLPDFVFMGEKDFQQQLIVKKMVKALNLPIEIISLPTVREYDGLAMSSRNQYLNSKERQQATVLYKSLCLAKKEIENGEKNTHKILLRVRSLLGSVPNIRLDYVFIVDPETLEEVKKIKGRVLIAMAVHMGHARLIDNLLVGA
ncbi:MAG: pantoate--beta-alanine ligase, partial [Candidatus Saganbacteria bacterium]|nr:pantoate--beta-alanine ligase [Candidatus Saganbacteria bacterium]